MATMTTPKTKIFKKKPLKMNIKMEKGWNKNK